MRYFIDILEADKDLNKAVDQLGNAISVLYKQSWDENMKDQHSGKPFNLNIGVFVDMWVNGVLKLFMVYDKEDNNKPVGFLIGMVFRPLPYDARVFQIEEWYVAPEHREVAEQMLLDHVMNAVRYMTCDEVWTYGDKKGDAPNITGNWKRANCFHRYRFVKG